MGGEQIRILVVDDEESIRNLLKRFLEEEGYSVVTAADGEEALDEMSRQGAEIALVDIRMPGMSGIELLGKLTTDWPDVCVIMATAILDTKTAVEAMKMGAYDYITKPFAPDEVVQKVHKAIEKWRNQLKEKSHYLHLKERFTEQTQRMQEQFTELVSSLAREHKLLHKLAVRHIGNGKSSLKELPPELQEPIDSVEEFKDALIRILKNG